MNHQLPSNIEQRISALQSIEEIASLTREELRWIAETGIERFARDGESQEFTDWAFAATNVKQTRQLKVRI